MRPALLVAPVLLATVLVPSARAADACEHLSGLTSLGTANPAIVHELLSASGTRAGRTGTWLGPNDQPHHYRVLDGDTGRLRRSVTVPGVGMTQTRVAAGRGSERAVLLTTDVLPSDPFCPTMRAEALDVRSGATAWRSPHVLLRQADDNSVTVYAAGAGDTDGDGFDETIVELRTNRSKTKLAATGAHVQQYGSRSGRLWMPEPSRSRLVRFDGRTGAATLLLDQPPLAGPGPMAAFVDGNVLVTFANRSGADGTSVDAMAVLRGKQLWRRTVTTGLFPEALFPVTGGVALVTKTSLRTLPDLDPGLDTDLSAQSWRYTITVLSSRDGRVVWTTTRDSHSLAVDRLDGDLLLHDLDSDRSERLVATDGRTVWSAVLGSKVHSPPGGDFNGDGHEDLIAFDPSGTSPLIDGRTGARLLVGEFPKMTGATWIGDVNHNGYDDVLARADPSGPVSAWDGQRGRRLWDTEPSDLVEPAPIRLRPGPGNDVIGWDDGAKQVVLLAGSSGREVWRAAP